MNQMATATAATPMIAAAIAPTRRRSCNPPIDLSAKPATITAPTPADAVTSHCAVVRSCPTACVYWSPVVGASATAGDAHRDPPNVFLARDLPDGRGHQLVNL